MRTELHFHLLPAVDDGPEDDAEAVELARLAVADGTGRVIVTPHAHCVDFAELRPRTAEVAARLAEAGVQLELGVGAELSPDHVPGLSEAALESVAHGPSGRRWLLLEAPLFENAGSLAGGSVELDQLLVFRPAPELVRYRTPLGGLYVAGASVHPGPAVHGASGAGAARAVLADRAPWPRGGVLRI